MRKDFILAMLFAVSLMLTACGGIANGSKNYASSDMEYRENTVIQETAAGDYMAVSKSFGANDTIELAVAEEERNLETSDETERKLIRTVNMELKVESDIQEAAVDVIKLVESSGGYTEQNSSYFGDYSSNVRLKLRVPKDGSDGLINELKSRYKLLNIDDSIEDITLNYTDIKTRLDVKTKTRDKYMEYLDKAENIEEIMSIEEKISAVTAEIESFESQMRVMDNQIDYTTIYINLQSDEKGVEQSLWDKIKDRFNNFSENVIQVFMNMVEWTIYALIVLVFVVPLFGLAVKLFLKIIRGRKNKKEQAAGILRNNTEKKSFTDSFNETKREDKDNEKK